MRKEFLIPFFIFAFVFSLPVFLFAQQTQVPEFYSRLSVTERKLFDTLPELTKQKLNSLYNLVKQQNLSKASSSDATTFAPQQTQSIFTPTRPVIPQPVPNRIVPITSFTPPRQQVQNPYTQPENNPYYGTPFEKYYADSMYADQNLPNNGFDLSVKPLTDEDIKNLPKLGESSNVDCKSNDGVSGNMKGTNSGLRFDTQRLCRMFGKKIKVVDAKRACDGPSRHCFGEAIDFEVRSYGDRKIQSLLVIALIGMGYNIGSYTINLPLHADHQNAGKWKTWSGVEHTNYQGSNARPYDIAVRDALNLIGMPANSSAQFRSTYGNPSKAVMSQKALNYIKQYYGGNLTPQPGII